MEVRRKVKVGNMDFRVIGRVVGVEVIVVDAFIIGKYIKRREDIILWNNYI